MPTIIEPLTADWKDVQAVVKKHMDAQEKDKAVKAVRDFHAKLCSTRVLDPACGTGNFLYVAMELMKRLEGEVLDFLGRLDADQMILEMKGSTVDPHQFLGLEINERAVPIAELVLWLGFLKWQLRSGIEIAEPVLKRFDNIRHQDAILAYDDKVLRRDEPGRPVTRWDGKTMKKHPVTGEDVPDEDARIEIYDYVNPRPAKWPEAEFIVGNPPFIGGNDMRSELGDGYAEACWKLSPEISGSTDFVMHFWDKAARDLKDPTSPLRQFGLITTNSITQEFSQRLLAQHLTGKNSISIVFAIADHPWLKSPDKAAVRIAMTVSIRGVLHGRLLKVTNERDLDSDTPIIETAELVGQISPKLELGTYVAIAVPLKSNTGIALRGICLIGEDFMISSTKAKAIGLGKQAGLGNHIRPYFNGKDITNKARGIFVIDFLGLSEGDIAKRFPEAYEWLLERVKPFRDQSERKQYRENWWIFAEPRKEWRTASDKLKRFIVTSMTAKHRFFVYLDASALPDQGLIPISLDDAFYLGVLSSRIHVTWALAAGGRLGVGNDPRYNKTVCFDPFPFPDPSPALKEKLRALGERLDAFRKERQAAHPDLTMTAMYNVLERLRAHERDKNAAPLTQKEKRIHEQGLISTLKQIHDEIDAAVFDAYQWPHDLTDEEILARLVALNRARAEEERQGKIRWLRPEFQAAKEKAPAKPATQIETALPAAQEKKPSAKPAFPASDGAQQIRDIRAILASADGPLSAAEIAARFRKTKDVEARVGAVLEIFVDIGQARAESGRYFLA